MNVSSKLMELISMRRSEIVAYGNPRIFMSFDYFKQFAREVDDLHYITKKLSHEDRISEQLERDFVFCGCSGYIVFRANWLLVVTND